MFASRADGRIKLFVTARALATRRSHARLFAEGSTCRSNQRGPETGISSPSRGDWEAPARSARCRVSWRRSRDPDRQASIGRPGNYDASGAASLDRTRRSSCSVFTGSRIATRNTPAVRQSPPPIFSAQVPVALLVAWLNDRLIGAGISRLGRLKRPFGPRRYCWSSIASVQISICRGVIPPAALHGRRDI